MCKSCGDASHSGTDFMPSRRKMLLGGATLAAAPIVAGAVSAAQAQEAEDIGTGPWEVNAYGNSSGSGPFEQLRIPRRALLPRDILIEVDYCAICHSDIHIAREEWPIPYPATNFPCVPGHEIVGRVLAVGPEVTRFQVGDVVGAGAMIDSCGECENCKADLEQYCTVGWVLNFNTPDPHLGGYNYGGFSDRVVVSERYVVRVPAGMNLAAAAPLLCAGITTFSPMQHWNLEAGQRVGVIGMGGLGHLAVKLGAARGADVTVFTTTEAKVEDARRLGATSAVLWGSDDTEAFDDYANRFDLLISTVPGSTSYTAFAPTLRLDGTLVIVGAREPIEGLSGSGLWSQRRKVSASLMGGMAETQSFLDYCASRNIVSDIELITPDQIDAAFDRIKAKDVRYRFVIDMAAARQA